MTGDTDGILNIFHINNTEVEKIQTHEFEKHPINHLDFDGNFILTGSRNTLQLTSPQDCKRAEKLCLYVSLSITMITQGTDQLQVVKGLLAHVW